MIYPSARSSVWTPTSRSPPAIRPFSLAARVAASGSARRRSQRSQHIPLHRLHRRQTYHHHAFVPQVPLHVQNLDVFHPSVTLAASPRVSFPCKKSESSPAAPCRARVRHARDDRVDARDDTARIRIAPRAIVVCSRRAHRGRCRRPAPPGRALLARRRDRWRRFARARRARGGARWTRQVSRRRARGVREGSRG